MMTRIDHHKKMLSGYMDAAQRYEDQRAYIHAFANDAIADILAESGLSLRKLAEELRLSPSYLSKVERGKEMMSPETAKRLVAFMNRGRM